MNYFKIIILKDAEAYLEAAKEFRLAKDIVDLERDLGMQTNKCFSLLEIKKLFEGKSFFNEFIFIQECIKEGNWHTAEENTEKLIINEFNIKYLNLDTLNIYSIEMKLNIWKIVIEHRIKIEKDNINKAMIAKEEAQQRLLVLNREYETIVVDSF